MLHLNKVTEEPVAENSVVEEPIATFDNPSEDLTEAETETGTEEREALLSESKTVTKIIRKGLEEATSYL